MTKETIVIVYPKQVCQAKAPIQQMKVEKKSNGTNVVVYGRNLEAICAHCGRKFKDHK